MCCLILLGVPSWRVASWWLLRHSASRRNDPFRIFGVAGDYYPMNCLSYCRCTLWWRLLQQTSELRRMPFLIAKRSWNLPGESKAVLVLICFGIDLYRSLHAPSWGQNVYFWKASGLSWIQLLFENSYEGISARMSVLHRFEYAQFVRQRDWPVRQLWLFKVCCTLLQKEFLACQTFSLPPVGVVLARRKQSERSGLILRRWLQKQGNLSNCRYVRIWGGEW